MGGIVSVEAEDFCCFEHIKLPLMKRGLVWLAGENHDTEAATSNGAGKTTLFKAISWGIYGQTVDGWQKDEVIREGAKCARVTTTLEDGWKVVRERRRGSPKLHLYAPDGAEVDEGTKELEARIARMVGMDFHGFRNTALYGQGDTKRFLRADDKDRKEVLHNILRTLLFKYALKWVREKMKAFKRDIDDVSARLLTLRARMAEHDLGELEARVQGWEDSRRARLEGATDRARKLTEDAKRMMREAPDTSELDEALADLEHRQELAEEAQTELSGLDDRSDEAEHALADAIAADRDRRRELAHVEEQLERLDGDECPTCTAPLDSGKAGKYVAVLRRKKGELEGSIKHTSAALKKARADNEAHGETVRKLKATARGLPDILHEKADVEAEIAETSRVRERAAELREQAKERVNEAKAIRAESNPHTEALEQAKERIEELAEQEVKANGELKELTYERAHLEFWSRGFGGSGLPSLVLDSVMPYLTKRANHYLETLADGDITMSFRTQRELKSAKGEFRDEIDVNWEIEGVSGYPPSGGQFKKMEIATDLAMMDLVATREGGHVNMLCLDECLDGLDPEGRERVLQLLHDLRAQRGTIFVISHEADMAEVFERSVTVVKRDGIATLEAA